MSALLAKLPPLEPAMGRVPPSDLDAEAAVLSACLLDAQAFDEVRDILKPIHLYADANRRILEAAYELQATHQPVDIVGVAGYLRDKGRLDQIGGTPYLAQLTDATPAVAHAGDHARRVLAKFRQRQMISACQLAAAEGYGDIGDNVQAWLDRVEGTVFACTEGTADVDPAEEVGDVVRVVVDEIAARGRGELPDSGVPALTPELTEMLGGYENGKLYMIAARPGMGKSAAILQEMLVTARAGEAAVLISAEMTKKELALRLLSLIAKIDGKRLKKGKINRDEWTRLVAAADELRSIPLALSFRAGATLHQIRGDVRRKLSEMRKKRNKPEMRLGKIGVDYLQILNGERQKGESREAEIANLTRGLMWMAMEFGCPLIAGAQLNRELERRPDKRPVLSDLRESGAIEQDSFGILFLYRDEYYNKDSTDKGLAEIIVAKNRGAGNGMLRVKFTAEYTRFDALAPDHAEFNEWDPADDYPQ